MTRDEAFATIERAVMNKLKDEEADKDSVALVKAGLYLGRQSSSTTHAIAAKPGITGTVLKG